ncbi:MAG: prepilin-type N-terminal cleavage/methylation domain-containing protein, partial [Thiotrichales bacterium]|nr:prepilin-type N-terminal cleavage/methylation domain-containing protein [Thiotrichales bacterium]
MSHTQHQKGFTLIELAIVVVVLGALFAIVAQQFNGGFTSTSKANAVIEGAGKMAS